MSCSDSRIYIEKNKYLYNNEISGDSEKNDECAICCQCFNDEKDYVVNLRCGKLIYQNRLLKNYRAFVNYKILKLQKLIDLVESKKSPDSYAQIEREIEKMDEG